MKKKYISPKTRSIILDTESLLAAESIPKAAFYREQDPLINATKAPNDARKMDVDSPDFSYYPADPAYGQD